MVTNKDEVKLRSYVQNEGAPCSSKLGTCPKIEILSEIASLLSKVGVIYVTSFNLLLKIEILHESRELSQPVVNKGELNKRHLFELKMATNLPVALLKRMVTIRKNKDDKDKHCPELYDFTGNHQEGVNLKHSLVCEP